MNKTEKKVMKSMFEEACSICPSFDTSNSYLEQNKNGIYVDPFEETEFTLKTPQEIISELRYHRDNHLFTSSQEYDIEQDKEVLKDIKRFMKKWENTTIGGVQYKKSFGGREKYFSTKYKKDITFDCVIRAIAHGTGLDYMKVFRDLCNLAITTGYLPNAKQTYEPYLFSLGWKKHSPMKNGHNKKVRLKNYKTEGTYIILTARHLTCIKEGILYDTWDCRNSCGNSYYAS